MLPDKATFRLELAQIAQGAISGAVFADIVYRAISAYGLGEEAFRDAFGLTGGGAARWMQGQNLPQPEIRAKIVLWIKENL